MPRTALSTKGQIVIPKAVRDAIKFAPGETCEVIAKGRDIMLKRASLMRRSTWAELQAIAEAGWRGSVPPQGSMGRVGPQKAARAVPGGVESLRRDPKGRRGMRAIDTKIAIALVIGRRFPRHALALHAAGLDFADASHVVTSTEASTFITCGAPLARRARAAETPIPVTLA